MSPRAGILPRLQGYRDPARASASSLARPGVAGMLFLALLLPACSKGKVGTSPVPTYSLSGRARLVGSLTDASGAPLGERDVEDADSVRVYLVTDGAVTDSTFTQAGRYGFRVRGVHNYLALARDGAGVSDSTEYLHLHDTDRTFADTIGFRSSATMSAIPNPFVTEIRARYTLAVGADVSVEVRNLGGSRMRVLASGAQGPGAHEVTWDGLTDSGRPVPSGTYWISVTGAGVEQSELVFREGFSISGPVQLIGKLADDVGTPTGLRAVTDANGIRVRLSRPDGGTDSTLTRGGRYQFDVHAPGTYRATTWVVPSIPVSTPDIVVTDRDVSVADTLTLEPAGGLKQLKNYPNPFQAGLGHGVGIEFMLDQAVPIEISVLALDGSLVWFNASPGVVPFNHIHWIGVDSHDNVVPNGEYWTVVRAGGQECYGLVISE